MKNSTIQKFQFFLFFSSFFSEAKQELNQDLLDTVFYNTSSMILTPHFISSEFLLYFSSHLYRRKI